MLTLKPGADPLDPASYEKSAGPVFTRTASTLGPGHASFTNRDPPSGVSSTIGTALLYGLPWTFRQIQPLAP